MFAPKPSYETQDQRAGENVILSVVSDLVMIIERLAKMGHLGDGQLAAASAPSSKSVDRAHLVALADEELRRRRMRARVLPSQFFGEAAWSMLLDLYVSEFRNKPVATTSACIAADVPASTALRWLDLLEQRSLVERYDSDQDRRVKFIRLSNDGRQAVEAILSSY